MTTKTTTKTTKGNNGADDGWGDAREVLVVAGTTVRPGLEEGEVWAGVYLGHVVRESAFGHVNMHLMQTAEGVQGMWGHHALDEGLRRAELGCETRIDGVGIMELDRGRVMRIVRIRQRGAAVPGAAVVRDPVAEAAEVYRALGVGDGEVLRMDGETGEVFRHDPLNASGRAS